VVRRKPFGNSPHVGDRGAETQRRILEAALVVFDRLGYHEAQVEAITEEAECSRPAFYQYFSAKEDVFWELARELAAALRVASGLLERPDPGATGLATVRSWLEEMTVLHSRYGAVLKSYPAAIRGHRPFARDSLGVAARIGSRIGAGEASADSGARSAGKKSTATKAARTSTRGTAADVDALQALLLPITMRTIHYWQLGLGNVSSKRFLDGFSRTIHRLQHGPVEGVNTGPVVKPPSKKVPPWPDFPSPDDDGEGRGRRTREKLIAAGISVLPERGYFETRVDDIVERAEVAHGTFYRYFSSKDDLFRVLALSAADDMVRLLGEFPEDPSGTTVDDWCATWIESYWSNGGIIGEWQEINYEDPSLAEFSLNVALSAFDRLQRIVSRRGFGDSTVDAMAMLALVERSPYISRVFGILAPSRVAPAMAAFARRAVLGVPPTRRA
jgi:AcrR family transcriptional regulator